MPYHRAYSLQGLIGEANSKYACGAFDEAERMCLEVIRSPPYNALPFRTLADIHEERGDMNKSIQFRLIAAHLTKTDADEWASVGGLYLSELGNTAQASGAFLSLAEYCSLAGLAKLQGSAILSLCCRVNKVH